MIGAALSSRGMGQTATVRTAATVTGFGSESYTYDAYGNLTMNGSTTLTTDTATNRLDYATTGETYDGAGNLTSRDFTTNITTYTYDRFNQLASVSGGGINRSQAYTADGERLFVRDGATYLFTLRDLSGNVVREYEYTAAGGWRWKRDNVYRGGLLLASEARTEGIKHYHLDHLGSPRLVTNRCGEKFTLFATSPFGKDPTATQSSERMRFTVHERDVGSLTDTLDDIDYMHARSYSARLARFVSIDAVRGDPARPQSWNAFAYVQNGPTVFIDPSGRLIAFASDASRTAFFDYVLTLDVGSDEFKTVVALQQSDVTYQITLVDTPKGDGSLTSDGQKVFVNVDKSSPDSSLNGRMTHELRHALQFERGEIGFRRQGAAFKSMWHDAGDELDAYRAQIRYCEASCEDDLHKGFLKLLYRDPRDLAMRRVLRNHTNYDGLDGRNLRAPLWPSLPKGAVVRTPGWFFVNGGR